jgi:U4/U6 small nuclear ribonucleoprotein PRP3
LTSRIDWTEEARPLAGDEDADGEEETAVKSGKVTQDEPESLEDNKCEVIWEGEVTERTFGGLFRPRHAESDTRAKEWLTTAYEGMWDLAKRHTWEGDDL